MNRTRFFVVILFVSLLITSSVVILKILNRRSTGYPQKNQQSLDFRLSDYNKKTIVDQRGDIFISTIAFTGIEELMMPVDIGSAEIPIVYKGYISSGETKRVIQIAAVVRSKSDSQKHFYCVIGISCTETTSWSSAVDSNILKRLFKMAAKNDSTKQLPESSGLLHLQLGIPSNQYTETQTIIPLSQYLLEIYSKDDFNNFYQKQDYSYIEKQGIIIPISIAFEKI
ncbi:MAG: hypothetical protein ACOZAN_03620 [Patescibacteria group bacterium]